MVSRCGCAVVLRILWLGFKLAQFLRSTQRPSGPDIVASFVLATAVVATLVHVLALGGFANLAESHRHWTWRVKPRSSQQCSSGITFLSRLTGSHMAARGRCLISCTHA